jgi:hypothetical protein
MTEINMQINVTSKSMAFSFRHYVSTIQSVYFYWSFGNLLLTTVAMALYAASVYDESRVAKDVLYAVPAQNYQVEVRYVTAANRTNDPYAAGGLTESNPV